MSFTAKHKRQLNKAVLCLFHLRLVAGEVWFVPLTVTIHFNLYNPFEHKDGALQI